MAHYNNQTFSDSDLSMSSLSDLAIADLLQNMSAAIGMKPAHARVAHACDHCRRLKTKVSTQPISRLDFFLLIFKRRYSALGNSQSVPAV